MMILGNGGQSADPFWADVTLLAHMDGTSGSTSFTDSSLSANSLVPAFGADVNTSVVKFGTGSLDTTNSTQTLLAISGLGNPSFQFASEQFTVEFWGWLNAFSGANTYIGIGNYFTSGREWRFGISSGNLQFSYSTTGSDNTDVGTVYTPTTGVWVAYAADRDVSNVLRVYVNGAVVASATAASAFNGTAFDNTFNIGGDGSGNWNGYIDEMRVTKGVARYAGPYTPATQPFPNF